MLNNWYYKFMISNYIFIHTTNGQRRMHNNEGEHVNLHNFLRLLSDNGETWSLTKR